MIMDDKYVVLLVLGLGALCLIGLVYIYTIVNPPVATARYVPTGVPTSKLRQQGII